MTARIGPRTRGAGCGPRRPPAHQVGLVQNGGWRGPRHGHHLQRLVAAADHRDVGGMPSGVTMTGCAARGSRHQPAQVADALAAEGVAHDGAVADLGARPSHGVMSLLSSLAASSPLYPKYEYVAANSSARLWPLFRRPRTCPRGPEVGRVAQLGADSAMLPLARRSPAPATARPAAC